MLALRAFQILIVVHHKCITYHGKENSKDDFSTKILTVVIEVFADFC